MKINAPKDWSEIQCWQLKELIEISREADSMDEIELIQEKISILTNIPIEDERILRLKEREVVSFFKDLKFLSGKLPDNTPQFIEYNDVKFKKINFEDMSVAEWITFEHYFFQNYKEYSAEIATTAFRRYKYNEFGEIELEKFEFDFDDRVKFFSNLTLDLIPITELIQFREKCFEIFNLTNKIEDEEEDEIEVVNEPNEPKTFRERYRENNAKEAERLGSVFRWDKLLMDLAGNDIKKSHELLNMPILYIFRIITMQKNL